MPWCASLLWLLVLVYNYTSDLYGDPSLLSDSLSYEKYTLIHGMCRRQIYCKN